MTRIFTKLSAILILLVFVISCETDFDTITEYEDITVVYGLLDQHKQDQYIKINKAFLSETDVLTYANDPESTTYSDTLLAVILQEIDANDTVVNTFVFDTTTVYDKEDGTFYSDKQVLYKLTIPEPPNEYDIVYRGQIPVDTILVWLNTENKYRLIIKNTETGKIITSETTLVDNFGLAAPFVNLSTITFNPNPYSPVSIPFEFPDNARRFEVNMDFHYEEVRNIGGVDVTSYTSRNIMSNTVSTQAGQIDHIINYSHNRFFGACDALIPYEDQVVEDSVISRTSISVEIRIAAAEENFALYLEVNEPSTSIVQDKPLHSNIENGIGIFSARSNYRAYKYLNTDITLAHLKATYPYLKF